MCGIAGYIGHEALPPERITQCRMLMRHRGPDADGCYHRSSNGSHVYLLHSRLSIIDLDSRANQPFRVGTKVMTYNGELYNYLELRDELKQLGRSFTTASDTEALLQVVDAWGWKGLDRCEGMWAFAVYDEKDNSLLLCRDRFGEKPLYVFRDTRGVFFGSEVKFIRSLTGIRFDIDLRQVYRYMVNGYKSLYKSGSQFFKGITEIAPGTLMLVGADGSQTIHRYWKPRCEPDPSMTHDAAVDGVRERLLHSVKLRLRSDVPLAFCMSGGIDSNALISIAKRVFKYDVHGFTIVNTDRRYEEQDMIALSVRELGIRHTAIPLSPHNFLDRLRTLVVHHDAPVYTITYFVHWLLQRSIADHGYRISISGTGADELFTGYYDHHLAYLYEIRNDNGCYDAARAAWQTYIQPLVRNPYLKDPDLFIRNPSFRDHIYLDAPVFASFLKADFYEPFSEHIFTPSLLRNRMLNELFYESVPVILHEDDLNAMYFSIENRSPFLDRHLFEFCSSIPTRFLMRDGYAKVLLRDALRGIVPEAILNNRRKVGFNAPIFSLLDVSDPQVRSALLDASPIFEHVHRQQIEDLLAQPHLSNSRSKFLFYFLCSKMFLEEFRS
ncbi:MAG: asparagine synthase (glutamine-hydrolyzing) [Desulfobacterota bacterium]|nr:asparagine synthase (glutamine-hydrolyzing) [Thermodesulfobacteriota bacterium]